jgi:hypothetical protein
VPPPPAGPDLRPHLLRALEADLVGPFLLDHAAPESLPLSPSRWYLTGFLAPEGSAEVDDALEEDDAGAGDDEDDGEQGPQEAQPKAPKRLPSSIGLSVLLQPGAGDVVNVRLSFAEYTLDAVAPARAEMRGGETIKATSASARQRWTRRPAPPIDVDVPLDPAGLRAGREVAAGIWIEGHLASTSAHGVAARALSLFVVNRRDPGAVEPARADQQFVFQVELWVRHAAGLVPRPNRRDEGSREEDKEVADLQFRARCEHAVGHNVAAEPIVEEGRVTGARTTWIPTAVVPRVLTRELGDEVTTGMEALAQLGGGEAVRAALGKLVPRHGEWIAAQQAVALDTEGRRETRDMLVLRAAEASRRIAAGIEILATKPDALEAFRVANRAMAMAARQRSPARYAAGKAKPAWRLFQLAFVLLNVASLWDEKHEDRENVELIFFPTGGGKTEAYLGVIAFTLALRRLRGAARPDGGLGVAVLLRYTLRLLTLDQLGRAATLICALELIRRETPATLGAERFSIGLWVGRSATANTLEQVVEQIRDYRFGRGKLPFPLPACPWCGADIEPKSLEVLPTQAKPEWVRAACADASCQCPFIGAQSPEGLPVLFVDEHIYRELPSFLVATVDKFAMLPWRGRTGGLFGRVAARERNHFFGPTDGPIPKSATKLPDGLGPPELIVQDELHLISGPLGTMVGLYETGIESLCRRDGGPGPKIVASTATVRRADQQVRSLFGRDRMRMFPPPGVDDSDTFFAAIDEGSPGRLYAGVAAPGRAMKPILRRTYVALLGAAQRTFDGSERADAYMTLVGYFNSLRELGGMRRMVEDEIRTSLLEEKGPRVPAGFTGPSPWVALRKIKEEPLELTSRKQTAEIAAAKKQIEEPHGKEGAVDVVLASNMISVGIDIDRLGLMVVAGQPKTTSEYIQASSRVGRDAGRPGLVVTVFNLFKPRDRSHYERFRAYHESFYRFVEASSVTPFSTPALDRGLAGLLVTMARLRDPALTPADGVRRIEERRSVADDAVRAIAAKAGGERRGRPQDEVDQVVDRVERLGANLTAAWAEAVKQDGVGRYSRLESGPDQPALLSMALDSDAPPVTTPWGKFRAPTSMRDVEPSVHLWKSKIALVEPEDDDGR